jgi:hypothetical protein
VIEVEITAAGITTSEPIDAEMMAVLEVVAEYLRGC